MFLKIENLPENIIGIEISGKITHKDYAEILIPLVEGDLAAQGSVKMLVVLGPDFGGIELAALWDDTKFGLKHWHDISHIAFVTDEGWARALTTMLAPVFPGAIRVFSLAEREAAREWVTGIS